MSENNYGFKSLTVFLLAKNETDLLRKTVAEIRKNCDDADLEKIIVVAKSSDCPGYLEALKMIEEKFDEKLEVYVQRLENGINCLLDLPYMVTGSHFLIMASDMEMDPENIRDFIEIAKKHPERIVCASKWMKASCLKDCGGLHALGSYITNKAVAFLYGKKATEIFSIYQIYPLSVFRRMKFDNPKRFMYEYTLKPLRLGAEYEEVPMAYRKRQEGKSTFDIPTVMIIMGLKFCATALRLRFTPKRYLNEEKQH